ncbi:MAG TPA: 50S ribosomal protein L18 [Candidatus Thermoplasmatota archaeon]|jgi:large subunit ribosomal protein L18|nr:50S ribosomal protein L18 [Candidatus Thermoplasmatota archaeon]
MAQGARYRVKFRRRREGRTDYRRRVALLKGRQPRVVVRRSLSNVRVQVVAFDPKGDKVLASADGRELAKLGLQGTSGKSVPAAYLTGVLAGQRAKQAGIRQAVLDLGRHTPNAGGRIFAALKGVLDAGLEVPHDEGVLPADERLKGQHIEGFDSNQVETVKQRILGGG